QEQTRDGADPPHGGDRTRHPGREDDAARADDDPEATPLVAEQDTQARKERQPGQHARVVAALDRLDRRLVLPLLFGSDWASADGIPLLQGYGALVPARFA